MVGKIMAPPKGPGTRTACRNWYPSVQPVYWCGKRHQAHGRNPHAPAHSWMSPADPPRPHTRWQGTHTTSPPHRNGWRTEAATNETEHQEESTPVLRRGKKGIADTLPQKVRKKRYVSEKVTWREFKILRIVMQDLGKWCIFVWIYAKEMTWEQLKQEIY